MIIVKAYDRRQLGSLSVLSPLMSIAQSVSIEVIGAAWAADPSHWPYTWCSWSMLAVALFGNGRGAPSTDFGNFASKGRINLNSATGIVIGASNGQTSRRNP